MKNCKGGKALASGGFGCVFSPALRCKGNASRTPKNGISKLMKDKYAFKEYEEINKIRDKLKNIKHFSDYFLLDDIEMCRPAKLTSFDLKNFESKCTALPKDGITKTNVNYSLDKLMILNMPNGGIAVNEFIDLHENLNKLNDSLIHLLVNGIVPMNAKNVYHCDIKESNVLVDSTFKTRLIDWGLSTVYIPNENNPFPSTWRNRPLQFNVPFSVIMFSDYFVQNYTKYINDGGKITENELRPFVVNYIHFWMKERGAGHYGLINEIMYILFSGDLTNIYDERAKYKMIETNFTIVYITNYIINVLENFTKFREDGTLDLRYYLDNVFIKIIDKWGFVIAYLPFLERLFNNYDTLSQEQLKLFSKLKSIYIDYLYVPTSEPIDVDKLVVDLRALGDILRQDKKGRKKQHKKTSRLFSKSTNRITRRKKDLLLLSILPKKRAKNQNKIKP